MSQGDPASFSVLEETASAPAPARNSSGVRKIAVPRTALGALIIAVTLSACAVYAATQARKSTPPVQARAETMRVHADAVELTPAAPQWAALKLAKPRPIDELRTQPIPALVEVEMDAARADSTAHGVATPSSKARRTWVSAEIFDNETNVLADATKIRVTVPSLSGLAIDTRVRAWSKLDAPEKTSRVRIELADGDPRLKSDMYAELSIDFVFRKGALELPATALVRDAQAQYVFVEQQPGTLVKRQVSWGPIHDDQIVVLSGLEPDASVVVQGGIWLDNAIALRR